MLDRLSHICADMVKKAHLELGGKDAFVVCEDSDLDIAVKAVAWASFLNTGKVCTSAERVYVQKDIYKPFLEKLKAIGFRGPLNIEREAENQEERYRDLRAAVKLLDSLS